MHIPDGFLDVKTAIATGVLAAAGLGVALLHARRGVSGKRVPLLGLTAAFVFAAQMLNFPVIGGTSGHLVGAVLTVALLGPSAAVIVLSVVLIVQCFMFADGGITALGANIFNMGIVGAVGGWIVYAPLVRLKKGISGRIFAAVVASWASTVLAAMVCAGELVASGIVPWSTAFPTMVGIHMLIGIGEGVITALVLSAIWSARPDLLDVPAEQKSERSYAAVLAYGSLIALGLALFVAPFACSWPDGLEHTARLLGFAQKESPAPIVPAAAPDYKMPGFGTGGLATGIAGGAGVLVTLLVAWVLARTLVPKTPPISLEKSATQADPT